MKSWSLIALACVALTTAACSSSSDKKETPPDTVVVANNSAETGRNLQGLWRMTTTTSQQRSDLPVTYAFNIDGDRLSVLQYDLRTQEASSIELGQITVLQSGSGEVALNEAAYVTWQTPALQVACGKSAECLKDAAFRISETLRYETPTWSYSDGRLMFDGVLRELNGRKTSDQTMTKTRLLLQKKSQDIRALALRSLESAPKGSLPLKRISVRMPNNPAAIQHTSGSTQTYACGDRAVVVPEFIGAIELGRDFRIRLNNSQDEALIFIGAGRALPTLTFWNPFRCGDKACSAVNASISATEVTLTESVDDCLTVQYTYGNL